MLAPKDEMPSSLPFSSSTERNARSGDEREQRLVGDRHDDAHGHVAQGRAQIVEPSAVV